MVKARLHKVNLSLIHLQLAQPILRQRWRDRVLLLKGRNLANAIRVRRVWRERGGGRRRSGREREREKTEERLTATVAFFPSSLSLSLSLPNAVASIKT
jgi:hypothetical protein